MPKISVIMGVYNGQQYLREAIRSILNQTYRDFEFIICDDGSKDDTVNIVREFAREDSRIVLTQNGKNLGLAASLNRCISLANGEYIARMDCDDIALPTRFHKQIAFLESNRDIDIVGTAVNLFDDTGIYGVRRINDKYCKINVFKSNFFIHPTVMMKKSVLMSVGGYTVEDYTYRTEDYDLWCKLVYQGYKGFNLEDILLNYREDKKSYAKRKFKYRLDAFNLYRMWFKKLNIPFRYSLYIYKPIIAGLIPSFLVRKYHKMKFHQ